MRIELERRVEERTRALIESEMRYRGLADRYSTLSLLSPVGIFMADVDGTLNCKRFGARRLVVALSTELLLIRCQPAVL